MGIVDAEAGEEPRLEHLHAFRVLVGLVVEAEEVQEAVHDEVLQVMNRGDAEFGRLAEHGLGGAASSSTIARMMRCLRSIGW